MKLSRILELALVHNYGSDASKTPFLCNAVDRLANTGMINSDQQSAALQYIQGMIHFVEPKGEWICMVNALHHAGLLPDVKLGNHIPYITQLYVWMIFDLKNKGL